MHVFTICIQSVNSVPGWCRINRAPRSVWPGVKKCSDLDNCYHIHYKSHTLSLHLKALFAPSLPRSLTNTHTQNTTHLAWWTYMSETGTPTVPWSIMIHSAEQKVRTTNCLNLCASAGLAAHIQEYPVLCFHYETELPGCDSNRL